MQGGWQRRGIRPPLPLLNLGGEFRSNTSNISNTSKLSKPYICPFKTKKAMSKKTFTAGVETLLGNEPETPKPEAPQGEGGSKKTRSSAVKDVVVVSAETGVASENKETPPPASSGPEMTARHTNANTPDEDAPVNAKDPNPRNVRATFVVDEALLVKLKAMAYWERKSLKNVVNTALAKAVTEYEKEKGEVQGIPKG